MKLNVNYFENNIEMYSDKVNVIEIENKSYFYRFIKELISITNSEVVEEITFFDNNNKEVNMSTKMKIFVDYFNFEFNSKKYSNDINKYIINEIDENDRINITKNYNKLIESFLKILNKSELPLQLMEEVSVENIIKNLKLTLNEKNNILDNLFLLVELEKILKTNNLLIFINLKQYLKKEELTELYKYSIYNNINIILIDSQSYGTTLEYEKKLIIDVNLDEFLI